MNIRVRVIFPNRDVKEWHLTRDHSAASYGMPVLVDDGNNAHGPADLPKGTVIRIPSKHLLYAEGARAAGYIVED